MKTSDALKLALSIAICHLAGIIGSLFMAPAWYSSLTKPSFTPPSWLFAPVWLSLYTLMGISLYLVLQRRNNRRALPLFSVQLLLNALWSILFFGLQNPLLALMEILLLWLFILLTILEFRRLDKKAFYLLIPYILWVSFAAILNLSIWMLNP